MGSTLRRILTTLAVVAYLAVFSLVIYGLLHESHRVNVLEQRPNCALVDDAVQHHRQPDPKVVAACEASARGLIDSLSDVDLQRLRRERDAPRR